MPADPAAVPPPEWAVKMVSDVGEDYAEELERLRQRGESYEIGTNGLWYRMHARLLASVREGALREAAEKCGDKRIVVTFGRPLPEYEPVPFNTACSECEDAILSLLDTPPSGGGGA